MKNKKLICILTAITMLVCAVFSIGFTAFAGDVSFEYEPESATLTVKGTGEISDYDETTLTNRPWNVYKDETEHIVLEEGITAVGSYAFAQFKYVQSVEIPSSVTFLGKASFVGINDLKELTVPDSVVTVGDYAFGYNENMEIPQDFVTNCSVKSAAQAYCFKNQIPFESPMEGLQATAHITVSDELELWSFVPKTDGKITFYSTGTKNTVGFLFDAQNYVYTTNYGALKKTALKYDDDWSGGDFNFKFSCDVTAGKRYYLGARFRLASSYDGSSSYEDGKFNVVANFVCSEHKYQITETTDPTCTDVGYETYTCIGCGDSYKDTVMPLGHSYEAVSIDGDTVNLQCVRCDGTSSIGFADNYHADVTDNNKVLDVNGDGVINAKDYAILYKK